MEVLITKSIKVGVEVFYQELESKPQYNQFLFSYRVVIENLGTETVQLLRRHWYIVDSSGRKKEVEGEGVIGKQPVLVPGQIYSYGSWCPIPSPIGKMWGSFQMKNTDTNEFFDVLVPLFQMIVPYKLN